MELLMCERGRKCENIDAKGKIFFECSPSDFRRLVLSSLSLMYCIFPFVSLFTFSSLSSFLPFFLLIYCMFCVIPFIIMTESAEFRDDFSSISKKQFIVCHFFIFNVINMIITKFRINFIDIN